MSCDCLVVTAKSYKFNHMIAW